MEYYEEIKERTNMLKENMKKDKAIATSMTLRIRPYIPNILKERMLNVILDQNTLRLLKINQLESLKEMSETENVTGLAYHLGISMGRHETIRALFSDEKTPFD